MKLALTGGDERINHRLMDTGKSLSWVLWAWRIPLAVFVLWSHWRRAPDTVRAQMDCRWDSGCEPAPTFLDNRHADLRRLRHVLAWRRDHSPSSGKWTLAFNLSLPECPWQPELIGKGAQASSSRWPP